MGKLKRMAAMTLASFMVMGLLAVPQPAVYAAKKCPSCSSTSITTSTDASGHKMYHCNRCGYWFI